MTHKRNFPFTKKFSGSSKTNIHYTHSAHSHTHALNSMLFDYSERSRSLSLALSPSAFGEMRVYAENDNLRIIIITSPNTIAVYYAMRHAQTE